jgi:O-acetyl-ADP-ribose deacetylase (regulator of RNase III)
MGQPLAKRVRMQQGDITTMHADAIVNAANSALLGGGGVDGAIHRAAGPQLLEECKTLDGCATGDAKITKGYDLPAKHVIHAVGPVYRDGQSGEPDLLASCYRKSLELAVKNNCKTLAFPAISCGVYGYPLPEAAKIAFREVIAFLQRDETLLWVCFVLFDQKAYQAFERAYQAAIGTEPEPAP